MERSESSALDEIKPVNSASAAWTPVATNSRHALAQEAEKIPSLGAIVAVRGSVVDVRFDTPLPPIYTVLRANNTVPHSLTFTTPWT